MQNNAARLLIRPARTSAFIQPWCDDCTSHPLSWPLDMVYRGFTRFEMDVKPAILSSGAGDDGLISFSLAPSDNGGDTVDAAAEMMASVELVIDELTSGAITARLRIRVRQPVITDSNDPLFPGGQLDEVPIPVQLDLPDFPATGRRYAVEIGWDWHRLPSDHRTPPAFPAYGFTGEPWIFVRVQYMDGGVWHNPMVEQSVPQLDQADPINGWPKNNDGTGGWIRFGLDTRFGHNEAGVVGPRVGFDRDDWPIVTPLYTSRQVVPYVVAQRVGSGNVDWILDDVKIASQCPDPVTLFVNTVGYDTAGGQWAMMRPNRTLYRTKTNLEGVTVVLGELVDGNGIVRRSTADAVNWLEVDDVAECCFREIDIELIETSFPWDGAVDDSDAIFWRRITWLPITTEDWQDCFLRLTVTTPSLPEEDGATFVLESHPFDFGEEIWWKAMWPRLAIDNELRRRADPLVFPLGGWNDAGNVQAEARSHGLFLSGLSHVLRARRPELSTAETNDLVDALKYGSDWMLWLVDDNTSDDPDAVTRQNEHDDLFQLCGDPHHTHFFRRNGSQEDDDGHIWDEHSSRPRGDPEFDGEDRDDVSNSGGRILNSIYGLADAVIALQAFDPGSEIEYRSQVEKTRDYLWWLDDHDPIGGPPCVAQDDYFVYRAQAAFDLVVHDAGGALSPQKIKQNDPIPGDAIDPIDNADLARMKLLADLETFPPDDPDGFDKWVGCNHGLTAPAHPPWLGLLRMDELELADPPGTTWHAALATIADSWYHETVMVDNALRSSRYWSGDATHRSFKGTTQRPNDKVAYEAHSTARLAMALDPLGTSEGPVYQDLRLLSVGNLNWLFGIHYGVRGRFVLPPSDREWECGAFLPTVGSANVVQNTISLFYWDEPSVLAGCGGRLTADTDSTRGPDIPPWGFIPHVFGNTETFIRRDGSLLMAVECVGNLLHRRKTFEAEAASAWFTSNVGGQLVIESNNHYDPLDPEAPYLNGGESVVSSWTNDWLDFTIRAGTPSGAPDRDAAERDYWLTVRAGNPTLAAKTLTLAVRLAGNTTPFFTTTVSIPPTGHRHDCVAVTAPAAVTLHRDGDYDLRVTFTQGDPSLDCITLKSRGK